MSEQTTNLETTILVVDDEPVVCHSCARILGEEGLSVVTTLSPVEGLMMVEEGRFGVILVDLKMPTLDGMEFLRRVKKSGIDVEVIMMTGYAQVQTAVEAMKLGALDYVPKPFTPDKLLVTVKRALEKHALARENAALRGAAAETRSFEGIVGDSKPMRDLFEIIARSARSDCTVLIRGESGTGKELVARSLHQQSGRKDQRFVPVDCGALNEQLLESALFGHVKGAFTGATFTKVGLFEIANGGTLFLDEIGNTTPHVQARLLRVLQEREYVPVGSTEARQTDIRLIAATNLDIEQRVARGEFREELFYRLNIVPITVPTLRERREDIPALTMHLLQKHAQDEVLAQGVTIAPEALARLMSHDWPGNVRELENVVQRAVVLMAGTTLEDRHLPAEVGSPSAVVPLSLPQTNEELKEAKKRLRERSVEEVERQFVLRALERSEWNVTRAAKLVGMARPNFQTLMRKYDISVAGLKDDEEP